MATDRTCFNRLEKLATFLDTLPRRKFDFREVVTRWDADKPSCGSVCCAIGWTPVVFPRDWEWASENESNPIQQRGVVDDSSPLDIQEFFGLTEREYVEAFCPAENLFNPQGALPGRATPKQVARNLRRIARKFKPAPKAQKVAR